MTPGEIYRQLKEDLALAEIRDVCLELDVKFEDIGGETRPDKLRELVKYMHGRRRLAQLVAAVKIVRPDIQLQAPIENGNGSFRADQYRNTWSCNMEQLSDEMQRIARQKTGLVGCTVSCSPETESDGLDKFLENLCKKSKALLEWDNICYVHGGRKLAPIYGTQEAMNSIKQQLDKIRQGKNVFFYLQLDKTFSTGDLLAKFWAELQAAFATKLGQDYDKLPTVFLVVMGSCSKEVAFPVSANVHHLGELTLTGGDLDDWMYRVVAGKSGKWTDARWDKSIPAKWANHISAYSKLQERLCYGSVIGNMERSLELLEESADGTSFLAKVMQTFS